MGGVSNLLKLLAKPDTYQFPFLCNKKITSMWITVSVNTVQRKTKFKPEKSEEAFHWVTYYNC